MLAWPRTGASRLRLGLGIAAAVVGAFMIWLAVPRADPAPTPAVASPTPPHIPILVSAGAARTDAVAVGAAVPIVGHAVGTVEIAALELWAGDERIGLEQADPPAASLHAGWSWTPVREGPTVLLVRAIDSLGRVAQSSAVRLTVGPADPETAVQPRFVLAVAPGPPELALAVPAVQVTLGDCMADVTVAGADPMALGLALYDLGPSALTFAPVASLPFATDQTLDVPLSSGLHLFAASAYTDDAAVYSDPVLVDVPDGCAEGSWSGPVRLDGGTLVLPEPVDRAYAYLRHDDGPAIRIPADPAAFIEPVAGIYDASVHLPPLDAETLSLEGWGWTDGQLASLGTGTWTAPEAEGGEAGSGGLTWAGNFPGPTTSLYEVQSIPAGALQADYCLGDICYEELLVTESEAIRPPPGVFTPVNHTFRWATPMPGVTDVAWQVFAHKPPEVADLDPPFVLDQGEVPLDDPNGGDFVLNLTPYLTGVSSPNLTAADQAKGATEQLKTILDPSLGIGSEGATTEGPINLAWLPSGPMTGGGGEMGTASSEVPDGVMVPNDLWVRVVPIQGSAPLKPSAPVHFSITDHVPVTIDTSVPDYADRYQLAMEHTPPVAPNPDAARCAVIADVTDAYDPMPASPSALIWAAIIDQGYVCYQPPDDGWSLSDLIDTFVEWVSDAWDFVSTAWDDIKSTVVDAVLVAVPCEEFASEDTCEAIAATALDAALVAVGVPPSIPDFDTTIGALKGEIGQAMIELAGFEEECALAATANQEVDSSLPTCQDIVDAAMEELVAQVEAQQHHAAANAIGMSVPDGIVLAPHPDGLWKPPSISITATRISDEPVPVACYLTGSMKSTLANHEWREMVQIDGKWTEVKKEGTVSAFPLSGPSSTLPDLPLHDSSTQTIWLTQATDWWESTGAKAWEVWMDGGNPYFSYPGTHSHTWYLLRPGAELTFTASSNCADPIQQFETLTESGAAQ